MAIQLADDAAELLMLYPHLGPALERDQGAADEERVSGSGALRLPVNADVLEALRLVAGELVPLIRWAAGVIGEPLPGRGHVDIAIRHLPRIHERMLVTAASIEADALAAGVRRTLRRIQLALGLRTLDRHLGQFCPLHDDPLSELIVPGDEGILSYRRVNLAGQPIAPTVEWRRSDCALCRHCRAAWQPGQYLLLGKLLREADSRRLAANAERRGAHE